MKPNLCIVLFWLCACATGWTQSKITITGRVTSQGDGQPIPGVNVIEKGTQNGANTDADGRYRLSVINSTTLTFSFVGMVTAERIVGSTTIIDVVLDDDSQKLSEVVVTGYKSERRADLTGAVSVIKIDELKDLPSANPIRNLQGRVPGVFITTDGSPGARATVRIRGVGTLGNNDPLYVIDGIPTREGLQTLNQYDIESFQVLKDASAASIYGSRAGNGVIIVTTKRGKPGQSRIEFNTFFSVQDFATRLQTLNTEERGRAYLNAAINDGITPNLSYYQFDQTANPGSRPTLNRVIVPEFIDAAKTMRAADTDWYNEITQTSLQQVYSLNMSTATDRGSAYFSASSLNHDGIMKTSNFNRLTLRLNTDYNFLNNRLKVGENLMFVKTRENVLPASTAISANPLYQALVQMPIIPIYTVTGGWGGPVAGMNDRRNPVEFLTNNEQNRQFGGRIFGNLFVDLEVLPKLHLRSSYGIDYSLLSLRQIDRTYQSGFLSNTVNALTQSNSFFGNWVWQNTASYDFERGKHRVGLLAGIEQIRYNQQQFSAGRQNFASEDPDYVQLDAGATNQTNGGNQTGFGLQSYFGKVNYSFGDRYLASVTLRRDGSSRFGANNRYGVFPAASVGWRISEESFIKDRLTFINDLKFRAGWGQTGNQEFNNFAVFNQYGAIYSTYGPFTFDQGTAYDIAGTGTGGLPSGYRRLQLGNPNLRWESTTQTNLGLDFTLFNYKLTGSFDWFNRTTKDILVQPTALGAVGENTSRFVNGATMQNRGIELQLSFQDKIGNSGLRYDISANVATYRNRITDLPVEVLNTPAYAGNGRDQNILGRSVNSLFGFVADGLFQTQAEVDAHATQPGKGPGRIRYRDLDGNGVINAFDQQYIGVADPDFTYGINLGLTYRGFDFAFFLQGVQGIQVQNVYKTLTDMAFQWSGSNWGRRTLDAWTPTNTGSTIPALSLTDKNNEVRASTYFIEDGSYAKLRNLQLGYSLPAALISRLKLQKVRLYVQGQNILTFSKKSGPRPFTGSDPENPNLAFPIPRAVNLGLNVTF